MIAAHGVQGWHVFWILDLDGEFTVLPWESCSSCLSGGRSCSSATAISTSPSYAALRKHRNVVSDSPRKSYDPAHGYSRRCDPLPAGT